ILLGAGNDVVLGGTGDDTITTGAGNEIIVGDNGSVLYSSPGVLKTIEAQDVVTTEGKSTVYPGNDTITVGNGNDFILGGVGNNPIEGDNAPDVVVGEDGIVQFTSAGSLISVASETPANGGNNTITFGLGNDITVGGTGSDTITAGNGNDIVIGNNGTVA